MKHFLWILIVSTLVLSSCGQPAATPITLTRTATATLPPPATQTPTPSQTASPTSTNPPPATATLIPTDAGLGLLLSTPQPAVCPQESADVVANFASDAVINSDALLNYLNTGGNPRIFQDHPQWLGPGKMLDLTGDGVNEIILQSSEKRYDFFTCKDGKYQQQAFFFEVQDQAELKAVVDLNQNNLPEIIFAGINQTNHENSLYIYEWDGHLTYRSLIWLQRNPHNLADVTDWVGTTSNYAVRDANGDGLKDVIVLDDVSSNFEDKNFQFVDETLTLGWNGKNYINLTPRSFDHPNTLVEIAALGDQEMLYGNYPKAIAYYNQLISDKTLQWMNPGLFSNQMPTSTPIPRTDQYALATAYGHYRLLILYTSLDNMPLATVNYNALQENFTEGQAGYPYAAIAKKFWDAYLAYPDDGSDKLRAACYSVVDYVKDHQNDGMESDALWLFNGTDSMVKYYRPEYICPFYHGEE